MSTNLPSNVTNEDEETIWIPFEDFNAIPQLLPRLDAWLTRQLPELTRSRIQNLAKQGRLTDENGTPITKLSQHPTAGKSYGLTLPPLEPTEVIAQDIPLDILFEDEYVLAINKPAGLVVHPAAGHSQGTLVNALLWHCPNLPGIGGVQRPGIVHRLDKDTSGVIIVAKTEAAMTALAQAFATHTLTKRYTAIAHGVPNPREATLTSNIGRSPTNRQKMAILRTGGKEAITHYAVDALLPQGLSRIQCQIETGRTHQIRVHLASLGTPIVGDLLYGKSALDHRLEQPPTRQLLHARQLIITHPITGQTLDLVAPYPADFAPYLDPSPVA